MKHKVITRCARRATRIGGFLGGAWKRKARRAYRRFSRTVDHRSEEANYEPPKGVRITSWEVI